MTREEAIECLKAFRDEPLPYGESIEAFDMAISALTSIMALSEDLKTFKKDIYMSEETLLGFNLAVSLFNKHFREK